MPRETSLQTLTLGLEILSIEADARSLAKLETYMTELEKWNPLFGLVGTGRNARSGETPQTSETADSARKEIIIRHILDSLAGLHPIRQLLEDAVHPETPASIADAGSGAGLPGIPLAVFLPETRVTLIEPSQKRCAFLRSAAALMKLENVGVFEGELAAARETFTLVTCRAFRAFDKKTLKALLAITQPRGVIAAYKGTREKAETESAEVQALGLEARIHPLTVPFLDEPRHLIIIQPLIQSNRARQL
ncbi:MAG: 16S rRNA (guanine(527)-N(7))-methyltransferase RsmG [Spirochaetales bacterium]|nr:16S rRNA (guanine(527)-N(7))-methyltransferase RsmG [Spirochaetales bacterium]